jgi:hypothetical protein
MCFLCLWAIGSPMVAVSFGRPAIVFLLSMVLALPLMIFATVYYGAMDSAGIGQLIGAGLYGLIIFGVKKILQWLRCRRQVSQNFEKRPGHGEHTQSGQ